MHKKATPVTCKLQYYTVVLLIIQLWHSGPFLLRKNGVFIRNFVSLVITFIGKQLGARLLGNVRLLGLLR